MSGTQHGAKGTSGSFVEVTVMWGHGMGYGAVWWMWLLMALGTIGFWLLVAYIVRAVIRGPGASQPSATTAATEPLRILDERLARGEIDAEEYQRLRRLLVGGH